MALFRRGFWLCSLVLLLMAISHSQWQGFVEVSAPWMDRRKFVVNRVAEPMDGDERLKIGSLVGYTLHDVPGAFYHTGIYVGPGDEQLRADTGRDDLHYVVEFGAKSSGSGLLSGKGGQGIVITPMKSSSRDWRVFEISLNCHCDYRGVPYSGEETKRRALSKLGTSFGGYDAALNNCQHFAVYVKYGVKRPLSCDEGKGWWFRNMAGTGAFATACILGSGGLAVVLWSLSGLDMVNFFATPRGSVCSSKVKFRTYYYYQDVSQDYQVDWLRLFGFCLPFGSLVVWTMLTVISWLPSFGN